VDHEPVEVCVRVVDHGGAMVPRARRTAAVALGLLLALGLIAFATLGRTAPSVHHPRPPDLTVTPLAAPVRFDVKPDHDEGQRGARHPDADDR
jgi:hypothetical protein